MSRKLKTYQATLGFFDVAVAAPSMKAALEAWGSKNNLFQMGFARESDDPAVIAAAMAKPGIVLKRAVGTTNKFSEHADLPDSLPDDSIGRRPTKSSSQIQKADKSKKAQNADHDTQRAARAFAREQKRQEQQRRKAEKRQQEAMARRTSAIAEAKADLQAAEEEHRTLMESFAAQRAGLDEREEAEERRWKEQRARLEAKLRRAERS